MRSGHVLGVWMVAAVVACGVTPPLNVAAAAAGDSPSTRYVVAYLVSAAEDSTAEVPEEVFPDRRLPSHPWQWRIYDPASGRDTLLLALTSFPTRVRWDPAFRFVEYAVAGRIERAEWRLGARPQEQTRLPVASRLCDFWADSAGRWHVITQREVESHPRPGYVMSKSYATRWDQDESGTWRAAALDSGGDAFGGCFQSERLVVGTSRPPAVTIDATLDSMRIGHQPDSTLREVRVSDWDAWWWVWVPSVFDPAIGLEMKVEEADSGHAMEPLIWVDRRRGRRRTVYARGDSHDDALGQVAFAQRDVYLLVVAEYSGAYPAVVDMRTGRVMFRVSRPSACAVWVPAPQ